MTCIGFDTRRLNPVPKRSSGAAARSTGALGADSLRVCFVAAFSLLAGLGVSSAAFSGEAPRTRGDEPSAGQVWAVLVGVEKYRLAPPLRHTINDVRRLAETLRGRGGCAAQRVLEIVDSNPHEDSQPLRASILARLPEWLAKPAPGDRVLVFFSVHGFRDQDGKLYLAPLDCNPANPAPTGISVEWLRQQIAACKASFKLLVLDACHAGSEKGEAAPRVSAKDLAMPFQDLSSVVTLASSTGDEKSLIWEDKEQSLFTYWLNQGLKGHADWDGDGALTIDELYQYLHQNVTFTARSIFSRAQTPVRIVRSGTPGVPVVIRLEPQPLKQVLADTAEQLADAMRIQKLGKLGVLEFTNDTKVGELLGADFGLLGRYCAEEVEKRMIRLASDKFSVVDRRRLQAALKDQGFALKDLASANALKQLAGNAGGATVLVQGTLRNRNGRVVTVQCKLVRTDKDELAGAAGGAAVLNESEWGMLGRSVEVRPAEDRRPEVTPPGVPPRPIEETVIARLDRRSEESHPFQKPEFPYRITIRVGNEERQGKFRGNDFYVPLAKDEVYQIGVENRGDEPVLMRLLVDGLNSLPERRPDKDLVVERRPEAELWFPAQRVNLADARAWFLPPKSAYVVAGFYARTGEAGQYHEFKVVDAQELLAARERFTDQLGLITAAFYAPKAGPRAVTSVPGEKREGQTGVYENMVPGGLRAVVHLRYVEPDVLKALTAPPTSSPPPVASPQ